MSDREFRESDGHARLDPHDEVIAGSYRTWRLTYVVGSKGVATGGHVRVHTDSDTDWGMPQLDDPGDEDYLSVHAPEGVRLAAVVEHVRAISLTVKGRPLEPGEKIHAVYGDTTGGGPGSRAQTFAEPRRYFWVSVDAEGEGEFVTLPDSPHVPIVGGAPVRVVALAPSAVVVGEPFPLLIRVEDKWGNPSSTYQGMVELEASGVDLPVNQYAFSPEDGGVWKLDSCSCLAVGVHRITVRDVEGELSAESNPILCVQEARPHTLYWGDPHGGQLRRAEKIPDFFRYARDVAGLDFVGYQANGHRLSTEEWALQQEAERAFYQPGRFVPLPGFEWSAETEQGGHHNVYFRRHDQPIRRHCHLPSIADQSDLDTDLPHIRDAYQAYRFSDVLITPHVGGDVADLSYHEPILEPVLEITSTHGTFEWFWMEALQRGYKMGVIGGSDGYTGRPGAEYPGNIDRRYAKGGLTALYAAALTIEGVHEALRARRAYGTTGARILIRAEGDGHMMGEEYRTRSPPEISAWVEGTAPLESVELFRGQRRIYNHPLDSPRATDRIRILWEGASSEASYSGVVWDGRLEAVEGEVALVDKLRFDSPRSYVFDVSEDGLRWHSVACGYPSGMILEAQGGAEAELRVAVRLSLISRAIYGGFRNLRFRMSYAPTERLSFSVSMGDLASGPREVTVGPLGRKVTVSLAPEPGGAKAAEFSFTDRSPRPGINPYWLRVVQTDMEMAWTSPLFVDYVATQ